MLAMLKNIDLKTVLIVISVLLNVLGGTAIVPPPVNLGSQTPTVQCPALATLAPLPPVQAQTRDAGE